MRKRVIIVSFLVILFGFSIAHIVLPDQKISISERRTYKTLPTFKFEGSYINELEQYLLDHFPLRDTFRTLKAKYNFNIMQMLDNNGIYYNDNHIFKLNYPYNEASVKKFNQHVEKIQTLLSDDNQVYMMLVPDKNYYVEDSNFLKLDYEQMKQEINFKNITSIDIFNDLSLDDYYYTDSHFKQIALFDVVDTMSEVMNFQVKDFKYQYHEFNEFYGVYYGESALDFKPDTITYVTNEILDQVEVTYLENKELNTLYNEANLDSLDPYEVFLDGASSMITIENKQSLNDQELIIFRDSFASSLTPLLVPYYSKITLLDNRYITLDLIKDYVEFTNQDVLLMYSCTMVNDCGSLKN